MREDGSCPLQATERLPTPSGPPLQIRSAELEEALSRSATLPAVVEDVVMKAIPALVQELKALVTVIVKDVLKEWDHSPSSRCLPVHANSTASRSFQLRFVGIFPKVIFTLDNIQQDEGAPLQVVLEDDIGSRVHVGPEASVKIRIFVLDGDFEVDDMDDWTDQDFDKNIAQPRKGKGQLLRGQLEIYLSNGVASISDIAFTDNSKSMRNGKFRLGARVVKGHPPEVKIRDAVSAAFKVKERRTKSYRKHRSLYLDDGILCLKNIGKSLYERLAKREILTVKDFLQLYNTDPNELRNILKVAENKWSELIKNAQLCSLTDEQYSYYDKASGTDLVLDCVFNVIRIVLNGRICQPYKDIADCQKEQVNRIRLAAYQKRKELQKSTPCNLTSMQVAVPNVTATPMPFGNPSLDQMAYGQNVLHCTVDQTNQGGQDVGLKIGLVSRESEMNRDQTKDSHFEHHKPTGEQDVLLCPPDQTGPHMPLTRELPTTKAMLSSGGLSFPSTDLQVVAPASCELPAASTPQTIVQHPNAPPEDAAAAILLGGNPSVEKMKDGCDHWNCFPNQTAQGGQDSLPNFEAGLSTSADTSWQSLICSSSLFKELFGDPGFEPLLLESHTNSTQPVDPQSNVGSYNLDGDLFTWREFMLNDTGPIACTANMVEDTMPQSNTGSDNIGAYQLKLADSMNGAQVLAQTMVPGANAIEDPMPQSNVGSKRKRSG
uniref:Calmodulin-binding protein 60 A n=1 Tax=Opuntia streptacantha TaxID=393608 RepID=A0A7C9EBH4_OPUST